MQAASGISLAQGLAGSPALDIRAALVPSAGVAAGALGAPEGNARMRVANAVSNAEVASSPYPGVDAAAGPGSSK
jgi:hypothetical protein